MDKYDKLEKLKKLLDEGAMTQEEYEKEKAKVLTNPTGDTAFWGMEENVFCMLMHLSQLLGMVIPFAGLVLPIVMWATAKDASRSVDAHGRVIFNWILSALIYFFVCFILVFLIIGIPLMVVLAVVNVVFVIIGGIKANSGEIWDYPLSIPFFKRPEALEELE